MNVIGLLLTLSWMFIKFTVKSKVVVVHEVYYITPTLHSLQDVSPCIQLEYNNHSFNCSVMTLNEFIDYHNTEPILSL